MVGIRARLFFNGRVAQKTVSPGCTVRTHDMHDGHFADGGSEFRLLMLVGATV